MSAQLLGSLALPLRNASLKSTRKSVKGKIITCSLGEPNAAKKEAKSAAIGLAAAAGTSAVSANAAQAAELSKPLQTFVDVVDTAGTVVESISENSSKVIAAGKTAVDTAAPFVERAGKALAPVGETAAKVTERTVAPIASDVTSKASSAASSALSGIESQLSAQGLDVAPVKSVVSTVVTEAPGAAKAAAPVVTSFFQFILSLDPSTAAEYVVVLYLAYLALPFVGGFASTKLRGYKGDVRPPQALNILMKEGGAVLVDLRTQEEVSAKGLLDLPKKNTKQLISLERTILEKGNFQNNASTEAQITAIKVDALKGVKKGSKVLLLDQQGRQAKAIAKELTNKGYGNVLVVQGGFNAWESAQLKTKAAFSVKADAASFGRSRFQPAGRVRPVQVDIVTPTTARTISGTRSTISGTSQKIKSLPPPKN